MSLLQGIIEPQDATGELKTIYEMTQNRYGFVPNAVKMQSINSDTIKFYAGMSKYFAQESFLSDQFRMFTNEIIARKDNCAYCISLMDSFLLNKFGLTKEQLNEIKSDPSKTPLEKKELTLLEFVLKVLKDSNSTTKEDIQSLYTLGYNDKEIFDAINFATSMQKMHIMLNALQIEND